MANSQAAEEVQRFIDRPKFAPKAWEGRLANPSDARTCQRMEAVLNQMARDVLPLVQANAMDSALRSAIASSLRSTKASEFDTEEREFICDEVERLAGILDVKVGNVLNRWLYGTFLGTLINMSRGAPKN